MLPIRFATRPDERGAGRVVHVDGSPIGESTPNDLHLSHWPGNLTPEPLKRDLSTEIAFAFLDLPEAQRDDLLAGAEAFVLNHYDTDGICALFVLTRPDDARPHRERLHEVALSGDFFTVRSDEAFAIDVALRELGEQARATTAGGGKSDKQSLVEDALALLGRLLEDPVEADQAAALERIAEDRAALEGASFDDLIYLDFGVWTSPLAGPAPGPFDPVSFDPGRHAFFGDGRVDRALLLGQHATGTTARFVIGTRSFFDVVSAAPSARPDLVALCAKLQALEPGASKGAWHHHDPRSASPELWFGHPDMSLYAEHAGEFLIPSAIPMLTIRKAVTDAIRDTWVLPDDDEEADEDEDIFAV